MTDSATTDQARHDRLAATGQPHLIDALGRLGGDARSRLATEIDNAPLESLARDLAESTTGGDLTDLADRIGDLPAVTQAQIAASRSGAFPRREASKPRGTGHDTPARRGAAVTHAIAEAVGQAAWASGTVGVVIVAGGEGSRLGFSGPKGTFPLGPVSGKTLYQLLFEKIVAIRGRYGVAVPVLVMTSPATDEPTRAFLTEHRYFGLDESDVRLFRQGTMPAVDATSGRVLLAAPDRLALSPDGHGGMLAAMRRTGQFDFLAERGVEQLFYVQIDNPLAPLAEASIVGRHLLAAADVTTLAVRKTDPAEKVGNIVHLGGRTQIIEYSDLPLDVASRRTDSGDLAIWAGNTAMHVFRVAFLDRITAEEVRLPFHRANKVVPHVDDAGQLVTPSSPNAIKLERFIFDVLPLADRTLTIEVDPTEAFAPLKNPSGVSSAEWVRQAMLDRDRRRLKAVGVAVRPDWQVEIAAPFAETDEQLAARRDEIEAQLTRAAAADGTSCVLTP